MTITRAIESARQQRATTTNRLRQRRAELRLEEIIKVAGIADAYEEIDRHGDLNIETSFARLYQATADEHLRNLIVQTFVAWQNDERAEEACVRGDVDGAVQLLKNNNPAFIAGAYVPAASDGAA